MQKIKSSYKYIKALAWLTETVARALVGYLVVVNNDYIVALVIGGYFLATAAVMFVAHFFKAYSK
mgnify:CR=1 FL=1